MSEPAVFDTSIYLQHFRRGLYKRELLETGYRIRNSSVVLAELYRGCHTEEEQEFIDELAEDCPIITPTEKNWLESGSLLSQLSRNKGYSPDKLRDLHFDFLIALSARGAGATVITTNRNDFEEIKRLKNFKLVCW